MEWLQHTFRSFNPYCPFRLRIPFLLRYLEFAAVSLTTAEPNTFLCTQIKITKEQRLCILVADLLNFETGTLQNADFGCI